MLGFSIEDLWSNRLAPEVKARTDRFRENLSSEENNDGKTHARETIKAEAKTKA